jgi:hypothetical protein
MLSALISFSNSSFAQKNINWSASLTQIKAEEKNTLIEEKNSNLTYETKLFDLDFHLEYVFDAKGKLDNVLYYRSLPKESNSCVIDYNAIKSLVIEIHGQATTQESVYNDNAKDNSELLCTFAATGEYKLETKWQGKTENINLVLNTWKGTAYIGLYYNKPSQ